MKVYGIWYMVYGIWYMDMARLLLLPGNFSLLQLPKILYNLQSLAYTSRNINLKKNTSKVGRVKLVQLCSPFSIIFLLFDVLRVKALMSCSVLPLIFDYYCYCYCYCYLLLLLLVFISLFE